MLRLGSIYNDAQVNFRTLLNLYNFIKDNEASPTQVWLKPKTGVDGKKRNITNTCKWAVACAAQDIKVRKWLRLKP
jgi:hypothetical protein